MLAYNIESFEMYSNDDEEEEENDDENKFYLNDVNVNEILSYADDIDSKQDFDIDEKIKNLIIPIKEENEALKK